MALVQVVLTWQFSTPCQSSNFQLIDFKFLWVNTFRGTRTLACLVLIRSPVAAPGGGEIYGSCDFYYYNFFLTFSGSRPVETRGPILALSSSKYAVWCKKVSLGVYHCNFNCFMVFYPKKYPKIASE